MADVFQAPILLKPTWLTSVLQDTSRQQNQYSVFIQWV